MSAIVKSVFSAKRNGSVATICFETTDRGQVSMDVDVRYLWTIAADLRAASIDLLAPVPQSMKDTLTAQTVSKAGAETTEQLSPLASNDVEMAEEVKGGFAGLEQAWDLCDKLNEVLLDRPSAAPLDIFVEVSQGSFLIDPDQPPRPSDNEGIEVDLRNEFKIVYRSETRDWVPDRRDQDDKPALEIG